jgi:hypothetical protein
MMAHVVLLLALAVPEGYVEYPDGVAGPVVQAYARGKPEDPNFAVVQVQKLGGTIGRGSLDHEDVETAARNSVQGTGLEVKGFEYRKLRWKSFDLELVLTRLGGARDLVNLSVAVPLAEEAIAVRVTGPAVEEPALARDLQTVVASIDGKSNWLSDGERSEKLGRLVGAIVGGAIGLGGLLWWRRRQRAA